MSSLHDFALDWAHHRDETLRLLAALSDDAMHTKTDADGRTLGRIAWHMVQTLPEMLGQAGITGVTGPAHDAPIPSKVADIVAAYAAASAAVVPAVQAAWDKADLRANIPMYGQQWPRRLVLSGLMYHEAHHRGQMTVLMRQAGLKVPGVFGPAREEWELYGMPTQA
ncbi:MAG: hypothetical protein RIT40_2457 [Planctomycetota bacterium]